MIACSAMTIPTSRVKKRFGSGGSAQIGDPGGASLMPVLPVPQDSSDHGSQSEEDE